MPASRQLCLGSYAQLMEDAGKAVVCPRCLRRFTAFDVQRNRDRRHPIVPSHLADPAGLMTVASKDYQRSKSTTPRPY